MSVAGKLGGIEPLLAAFFGFLFRKTDFYVEYPPDVKQAKMGFPVGAAEAMLLRQFRSLPTKSYEREVEKMERGKPSATKTVHPAKATPSAPEAVAAPAPSVKAGAAAPATVVHHSAAFDSGAPAGPQIKYAPSGKQVPVGNGGVAPHYTWTQTLYELTVHVPVPLGTRASDLDCTIAPGRFAILERK